MKAFLQDGLGPGKVEVEEFGQRAQNMEAPMSTSPNAKHSKELRALRKRSVAAQNEILAVVRDTYNALYGGFPDVPKKVALSFQMEIDPTEDWQLCGKQTLYEQIERTVKEAGAKADCFRQGAAYCYHCETSQCEHALSPRPKAVFQGYSSSGVPQWTDFAQLLVDRGDDRAYLLFEKNPPTLASVILGRDLKRDQLHLFGKASKSYDVLGQVASGYFESHGKNSNGKAFALTFQAVESRGPFGETRLDLNLLGHFPRDLVAREYFEENANEALRQALITAELNLEELRDKLNGHDGQLSSKERSKLLGKVPGILRDLGVHIERTSRLSSRRTRHAQKRSREDRPTAKAIDDARDASPEKIFCDLRKDTIVILGRRNRVHVFGKDGSHVTSLSIPKDAVAKRLRKKRWVPASPPVSRAFREALSHVGEEAS